jgi:hypothetical protein
VPSAAGACMSDSRRHKTVIPASCTVRSAPRVTDRRARLLASSALSGGTLRGLALAVGVSIAATALWAVPARPQQSLNLGTATGTHSYASGNGATATENFATATGEFSTANGTQATATGQSSIANGATASAFGQGSNATGAATTAIGQASVASATGATAAKPAGSSALADTTDAFCKRGVHKFTRSALRFEQIEQPRSRPRDLNAERFEGVGCHGEEAAHAEVAFAGFQVFEPPIKAADCIFRRAAATVSAVVPRTARTG